MADFRRSAGIWIQYLGGPFLSIRGNFCKKNYMIWALNAFCVYQKFHSIILTQHGSNLPWSYLNVNSKSDVPRTSLGIVSAYFRLFKRALALEFRDAMFPEHVFNLFSSYSTFKQLQPKLLYLQQNVMLSLLAIMIAF